jgi:hypothetical protein
MCGIAPRNNGRILRLPVSPRELRWWPFRVCECQSGATLKANYSVICWMEPVNVKPKIGKTVRLNSNHLLKAGENR